MSIFGNYTSGTYVSESLDSIDEATMVYEGTTEEFVEIIGESMETAADVMSGLYIADALVESQLVDGTISESRASALMEASVKKAITKIKEKLIAIFNKIKEWFKRVFYNIKITFTKGKDFVDKYEDDINQAIKHDKIKDFKYKGYKLVKSEITGGLIKEIDTKIGESIEAGRGLIASNHDSAEEWIKALTGKEAQTGLNKDGQMGTQKFWTDVVKKGKIESWSDARTEILKAYHGGKSEAGEVKFSDLDIPEMIKAVKNQKDIVDEINKTYSDAETLHKNIISAMERAEAQVEKVEGGNVTKYITATVRYLNTQFNLVGNVKQLRVQMIDDYVKASVRILKAIVKTYGPHTRIKTAVKNSADFGMDDEDGDEPEDALEAALMKLF